MQLLEIILKKKKQNKLHFKRFFIVSSVRTFFENNTKRFQVSETYCVCVSNETLTLYFNSKQ